MTNLYYTNLAGGHVIYFDGEGCWRYADNDEKYYDDEMTPRSCPNCNMYPTWCVGCKEYHDACLGHIPNATNACCGHGYEDQAYIRYKKPKSLADEAEQLLTK